MEFRQECIRGLPRDIFCFLATASFLVESMNIGSSCRTRQPYPALSFMLIKLNISQEPLDETIQERMKRKRMVVFFSLEILANCLGWP